MAQSAPAPAPVLDFVARFEANPNATAQREFCISLLDLEVSRVAYNVMSVPPRFEATEAYKADIIYAERILKFVRCYRMLSPEQIDIPYHWLTLLGHRLAAERGLPVADGITALAHVASKRLGLPLKETEIWSEGVLYQNYIQTVLRDEWDYTGLQFRTGLDPQSSKLA